MQRINIASDEVICVILGDKNFYIKPSKSGRLVILTGSEYQDDQIGTVLKQYRSPDGDESV